MSFHACLTLNNNIEKLAAQETQKPPNILSYFN